MGNHGDALILVSGFDGTVYVLDQRDPSQPAVKIPNTIGSSPPWALSACWNHDGSKVYVGRRNNAVDEIDFRSSKLLKTIRLPSDSGPVSLVAPLHEDYLVCASFDNIRIWDLSFDLSDTMQLNQENSKSKPSANRWVSAKSDAVVPFSVIPGHHGGVISSAVIDYQNRFMVTSSGNRGWGGESTSQSLLYRITPK